MLFASNNGAGMNVGFPDVCLTPAGPAVVPVPYPNLAMNMMAAVFAFTVFITKRPALNMGSVIPLTTGDEGGVAHPMIKGPGTYSMGNPKVFAAKLPAINLTCPSKGNGVNNGLGASLVPSIVNVFYSLATAPPVLDQADPYARQLDLEAAATLTAALERGLVSAEMLDGGVGLLKIAHFSRALPSEVYSALRDLEARGMRRLIVDLTGCPGGDTEASLSLAGDFLPERSVLAVLCESDGDETTRRSVAETAYPWPLSILVDERTASAAEVFAGCLAFHGRALLVGSKTFGKGAAQSLFSAADGALSSVSVAELRLPDGSRIEGVGIEPHVAAGSPEEALRLAHRALQEPA